MNKHLTAVFDVVESRGWLARFSIATLVILAVFVPALMRNRPYFMYIAMMTCIFSVLALSFNLVWGYTESYPYAILPSLESAPIVPRSWRQKPDFRF